MEPQESQSANSEKSTKILSGVLILLIVASLAFGGYLIYTKKYKSSSIYSSLFNKIITYNWPKHSYSDITMKYPPSWQTNPNDPSTLTSKYQGDNSYQGGTMTIQVFNDSMEHIMKNYANSDMTREDITLQGHKAVRFSGSGGALGPTYVVLVVTEVQGKTYILNMYTKDATQEQKYTDEFIQTLSTLSFVQK